MRVLSYFEPFLFRDFKVIALTQWKPGFRERERKTVCGPRFHARAVCPEVSFSVEQLPVYGEMR